MHDKLLGLLTLFLCCTSLSAQQLNLKRGAITDSIPMRSDSTRQFALYLPNAYQSGQALPLLVVLDAEGRSRQALGAFREAAEAQEFLMVAPRVTLDSLSVTDQVILVNELTELLRDSFSIRPRRVYATGFGTAGQLAGLVPAFISDISGVMGLSAVPPSTDLIDEKVPYFYIGMAGKTDYSYGRMIGLADLLDRKDVPHQFFLHNGGREWPSPAYLERSLELFQVHAMQKNHIARDPEFLNSSLQRQLREVRQLLQQQDLVHAYLQLRGLYSVYRGQGMELDSLENELKQLRKDRRRKAQARSLQQQLFKEGLKQDDFGYYLEEDLQTYNFNNLGWWKFQVEQLQEAREGGSQAGRESAARLLGYLNALVEDYIADVQREAPGDLEAQQLLYMLKTITAPEDPTYYLKVISTASEVEDFGTALFYLETLLETGYRDREALYALEHTALLRITPEFNALIAKYFDDPRYRPE